AVLALTAAGCGGSKPAATHATDLHTLGAKLGCTFTEDTGGHELYTADQGECGPLTLYRFTGPSTRDAWLKAAQTVGGDYVVGPDWVVAADSPAAAASARAKVG